MKKSPHNIKVVPLSIIYTGVVFIIVLILLLFNAENLVTGNFDIGKWISSSKEPINVYEMLVKRDGTYVTRDTRKPYSGPVFSLFSDGQKASEGTLKNGVFDGMYSEWFDESGGVKVRGMYINGKKDGLWEYGSEYFPSTFYSAVAPEMFSVRSYRSGVIEWDNGRKVSERYWDKDGNRD